MFDVQYEVPNAYLIPIVPPEEVAKGDVVIASRHGSYIDRAYVVEAGENPRANSMRAMPFNGDHRYDLESGKFGSLLEPYQPGAPVCVRVAGQDALGTGDLPNLPSLEIATESPDFLELYTVVRVVGDKVILTGGLGKIRLTSQVATVPISMKETYRKGDKVLAIWETPFFRSATYARFDRKTGHHLVRFKGDNEDKRVPLGEILAGSKADYLGEGVWDEPEVWDTREFESEVAGSEPGDSDGASALPEGASVVGKYDTGTIRRYVRRKLPRIQHCYEKELIEQSNLEGTVVAQFSINKDGKVRNAKASGMSSKVVEKCIAKAISSIRFPIPKSGGSTKVRYPFTFAPLQ